MTTPEAIRDSIRCHLVEISQRVNEALAGGASLQALQQRLERMGRGGKLPHWYPQLYAEGTLPNLDGKSLGSVLEMIFVAVLEEHFFRDSPLVPFRINPARGIDIPALELGVKSPSENFCTSEPFFSAYERLLGNGYDAVVLLTDYQQAKKHPPLAIRVINQRYLSGSQIADKGLCRIAKRFRDEVLEGDIPKQQKIVRFLAFANQSDWEAKALLRIMRGAMTDAGIDDSIAAEQARFVADNLKREKEGKPPIQQLTIDHLLRIQDTSPRLSGLIDVADEWVTSTHQDFGRYPNQSEWIRFGNSSLDGVIGMSYALQWRYNFKPLFAALSVPTLAGTGS